MTETTDTYSEAARRIADRVRQFREVRGLSQERLAARADLAARQVQRIEAGTANPRLATLVRLAGALGVDVGELLAPEEPPAVEQRLGS